MGGYISVTSELNKGSEFTINLNMICSSKKFISKKDIFKVPNIPVKLKFK